MRVAELKYYRSGVAKNHPEAFKMLIEKNMKHGPIQEWQGFRDNNWWTYENHEILQVNQFALTKIYKSFMGPRKKGMSKLDAIELMTKNCKIIPDEKTANYCYGMSKMHIVYETTQKNQYDEMKYVEFLELLGRCAYAKYKDEEDLEMPEKLKMLLDELLPNYGMTRKEVDVEEAEFSESDPDY